MLEMVGTSSWIYLEISWLSLLLQLIELIKLVLSLVQFYAKLVVSPDGRDLSWRNLC